MGKVKPSSDKAQINIFDYDNVITTTSAEDVLEGMNIVFINMYCAIF